MPGRSVPSVIALPATGQSSPKLIGKARSAYSGAEKEPS